MEGITSTSSRGPGPGTPADTHALVPSMGCDHNDQPDMAPMPPTTWLSHPVESHLRVNQRWPPAQPQNTSEATASKTWMCPSWSLCGALRHFPWSSPMQRSPLQGPEPPVNSCVWCLWLQLSGLGVPGVTGSSWPHSCPSGTPETTNAGCLPPLSQETFVRQQ